MALASAHTAELAALHQRADHDGWPRLREAGLERFAELGYPSTRLEEWRYTPSGSLSKLAVLPLKQGDLDGELVERALTAAPPGPRVVLSAGRIVPELSTLPAGVSLKAWPEHSEALEGELLAGLATCKDGFAALAMALLDSTVELLVPRTAVLGLPLHLIHLAPASGCGHHHLKIELETGARLSLVETFLGGSGAASLEDHTTRIIMGRDAKLSHARLVAASASTQHLSRLHLELGHAAAYEGVLVHAGRTFARTELVADLFERSELRLGALGFAGAEHVSDVLTVVHHLGSHAQSRQLAKNIVADRATGTFNGRVRVAKGTAGNSARQTNKNLLLGEGGTVNTRPQLQIDADDVECAHGATVGQLDEQSLFYLRSRGIGEAEARATLTWAFAMEVLDEHAAGEVRAYLAHALGAPAQ